MKTAFSLIVAISCLSGILTNVMVQVSVQMLLIRLSRLRECNHYSAAKQNIRTYSGFNCIARNISEYIFVWSIGKYFTFNYGDGEIERGRESGKGEWLMI